MQTVDNSSRKLLRKEKNSYSTHKNGKQITGTGKKKDENKNVFKKKYYIMAAEDEAQISKFVTTDMLNDLLSNNLESLIEQKIQTQMSSAV